MADAMNLEIQIKDNATEAAGNLDKLAESLGRIKEATKGGLGLTAVINGLKKLGEAHAAGNISNVASDFEKLANSLERIRAASAGLRLSRLSRLGSQVTQTAPGENGDATAENADEAVEEVQRTAGAAQRASREIAHATSRFSIFRRETHSAAEGLREYRQHLTELRERIISTNAPLGNLLTQMGRMIRVRMIRGAVKALASALKEGYTNLYEWSKLTGGSFAGSIDTATNALGTMKNSIAAAVAPAIEALVPILQTVVSWVNTACNALAQFFALITGRSTWTSATGDGIAEKLDKTKKAATGAGGAMKELLASFDQLNIIASEGGGGGGGGSSTSAKQNFEGLFQENEIFDGWIKDTVTWLEEHLPVVYGVLAAIASLVLGLKPGIAITIGGITMAATAGYDIGYNGLTTENAWEAIVGLAASAIGGYMVGGGLGAAIGLTIAAGAMIYFYVKGAKERERDDRWGDVTLTADQIKARASAMFQIPINAEITVMETSISNESAAKKALDEKIATFSNDLMRVQLGIANKPEDIEALANSAKAAITAANELLKTGENNLMATTKIVPVLGQNEDGTFTDISAETIKGWLQHDKKLSDAFDALGEEIAKWMDKGVQSGWKKGEAEMVQQYTERLQRILLAAQEGEAMGELLGATSQALSNYTRDTAEAILEEQSTILTSYESKLRQLLQDRINGAFSRLSMAQAWYETSTSAEEKAKWAAEIEYWQGQVDSLTASMDESMKQGMGRATAGVAEEWKKALQKNIGGDEIALAIAHGMSHAKIVFSGQGQNWMEQSAEDVAKEFRLNINKALNELDPMIVKAGELFGFTEWDLIGEEAQTALVKSLQAEIGSSKTLNVLQQMGVTITKNIANAIKSGDPEVGAALDALMNSANKKLSKAELHKLAVQLGLSDEELENLKRRIEDIDPKITVTVDVIANIKANVTSGVTKGITAIAEATKTVAGRASGGYVDSGELYIARENGMNEFIGRIGNQGAVANNDQMVEAMSTGVRDANAEQNALLREQNRLLMQLVNKKIVAELKPSAGVGRSIEQSRQLYARSVGGV